METKAALLNPTTILTKTNLFYATILVLPMITHGNQLLVGTAVNIILFLGAKNLTAKELVPLAILPSIGAIANGILFGSFTMFLIYFAPAIWLSNYLLMTISQKTSSMPAVVSLSIASLVKSALLFTTALALFKLSIVPSIFLTAMGVLQLITSVSGGLLALLLGKSKFLNSAEEK